ncbi:hypothetical protein WKH15_21710 [Pantoea agglomerans]|uniref:hypothetical protein n=1 Tax=Enterobacter agglomerans TaxID=549 RepID=UPI003C7DB36C
MEMTQHTLRISRELSERIKSHSKAIKIPVNTFLTHAIENALNVTRTDFSVDELTSLRADPVKTLSDIHYKISDPWNTNKELKLSSAEIEFLSEGARRELDKNDLRWPFYEDVKEKLSSNDYSENFDFLRVLFGFALPNYITDQQARIRFACSNTPSDIPTSRHSFSTGDFTFSIVIKGNEGPFADPDEINRPPTLQLLVETDRFYSRFDWDVFIPFVRLMQAVDSGQASRCHKGGIVRLSRSSDEEHPWFLYLGKLQLSLTEQELSEIAKSILNIFNSQAYNSLKQMHMIFGEAIA